MKTTEKPVRPVWRILRIGVLAIVFLLGVLLFAVGTWYRKTFGINFAELLYTLRSSLKGTGNGTVREILNACLPPLIPAVLLFAGAVVLVLRKPQKFGRLRRAGRVFCPIFLAASVIYSACAVRLPAYLANHFRQFGNDEDFYELYYVDPDGVALTSPGKPKNLIFVYLESMETTYADVASGGAQEENYIPRLTALANDPSTVSFSGNDGFGGFISPSGTGWTMGALMCSTSGVPFSISVFGEGSENTAGGDGSFANGLVTLGDILALNGYEQEFLCGSDASFAGRDIYFTVHGNYRIYDIFTAQREGKLPTADYMDDWWGFEDYYLYDIAKEEILRLASGDAPFNFTFLTVDTHHVSGHICPECGDRYEERLMNVLECADRQFAEFLDWCREQEFFDDTLIVVVGDHPRMDTDLVSATDYFDRTIYNCFLNSAVVPTREKNRVATTADLFPTTLAALGFTIPGDRLGLGTNLFSASDTLAEQIGFSSLNEAFGWYSPYYNEHFLGK